MTCDGTGEFAMHVKFLPHFVCGMRGHGSQRWFHIFKWTPRLGGVHGCRKILHIRVQASTCAKRQLRARKGFVLHWQLRKAKSTEVRLQARSQPIRCCNSWAAWEEIVSDLAFCLLVVGPICRQLHAVHAVLAMRFFCSVDGQFEGRKPHANSPGTRCSTVRFGLVCCFACNLLARFGRVACEEVGLFVSIA